MYDEIIRWANDVRDQYRLGPAIDELPKGIVGRPSECVLARALGPVSVYPFAGGGTFVLFEGSACEVVEDLPEHVGRFAHDFDLERYPDLVEAA